MQAANINDYSDIYYGKNWQILGEIIRDRVVYCQGTAT